MRDRTVCFSGHRPKGLPDGGSLDNPLNLKIISILFDKIGDCIKNGYTSFITGGAPGIDLWAAKAVLRHKSENSHIRLICAIPFKNYSRYWDSYGKWEYQYIIDNADEVVYISDAYYRGCMRSRNCYMVDSSSMLIAVFDKMNSGTGQTIRYAQKSGIDIMLIEINSLDCT